MLKRPPKQAWLMPIIGWILIGVGCWMDGSLREYFKIWCWSTGGIILAIFAIWRFVWFMDEGD